MLADALGERPRTGSLRAEALPRLPTEEEQPAAGARPRARRGAAILAATLVAAAAAAGAVAAIAVAPFGDEDSAPAAQRGRLGAAWKQLASTRGELRDRLAAADTPTAQAAAATALGDLYGRAARTGAAARRSRAAAREAGAAYERLASAAAGRTTTPATPTRRAPSSGRRAGWPWRLRATEARSAHQLGCVACRLGSDAPDARSSRCLPCSHSRRRLRWRRPWARRSPCSRWPAARSGSPTGSARSTSSPARTRSATRRSCERPQVDGYVTRIRPDLTYLDGSVPRWT